MKTKLIIIAAVSVDGVIGIDNDIPWHIPEDFKHFKETTMGNMLIVGATTFLTLPPKAHQGREFVILNSGEQLSISGEAIDYYQFSRFDTVIDLIHHENTNVEKMYIIGGSSIYDLFIAYCDECIITWVNKTYPKGNKKFPINKLFDNFVGDDDNDSGWLKSKNNYEYRIRRYIRDGSKEKTQNQTDNDK